MHVILKQNVRFLYRIKHSQTMTRQRRFRHFHKSSQITAQSLTQH